MLGLFPTWQGGRASCCGRAGTAQWSPGGLEIPAVRSETYRYHIDELLNMYCWLHFRICGKWSASMCCKNPSMILGKHLEKNQNLMGFVDTRVRPDSPTDFRTFEDLVAQQVAPVLTAARLAIPVFMLNMSWTNLCTTETRTSMILCFASKVLDAFLFFWCCLKANSLVRLA